ncbi:regulating synaptic membrane exocytosis protein 2-like [Arapaima gigas]
MSEGAAIRDRRPLIVTQEQDDDDEEAVEEEEEGRAGGPESRQIAGKMQFETLRQFCSSVLSHFNGAFSPPQNILHTELLEHALGTIGGQRMEISSTSWYSFSESLVAHLENLGTPLCHLLLFTTQQDFHLDL